MGRKENLNKAKDTYKNIMQQISSDKNKWKEFLEFSSRFYKYSFTENLLMFAQNPDVTMCATLEEWNSIGRWVKPHSTSMKILRDTENEIAQRLRHNSVFKKQFNKEWALEFVNDKSKEKFIKDGFTADFFERADYIIFGLPKNCIEGVVVGRQVEHNEHNLNTLKSLFPNCYICNLDGVVIK